MEKMTFAYTDHGVITVACTDFDDYVRISVADTGKGISKDILHKLFQAYEQADSSFSRGEGGLGIGLTIAKRLTHTDTSYILQLLYCQRISRCHILQRRILENDIRRYTLFLCDTLTQRL